MTATSAPSLFGEGALVPLQVENYMKERLPAHGLRGTDRRTPAGDDFPVTPATTPPGPETSSTRPKRSTRGRTSKGPDPREASIIGGQNIGKFHHTDVEETA